VAGARALGWRPPALERFRREVHDIYVAPGDIGAASELLAARSERRPFAVDPLSSDQVGAQRTISRFAITPALAGQRRAPPNPGSSGTAVRLGRDAGQSLVDEVDDHGALADRCGAALD